MSCDWLTVALENINQSLPDFIPWEPGTSDRFCRTEVHFCVKMATYTKTWHWNCASCLCTNNYRTKGITYYTLPSDPELQKGYRKVLMNENINWRKHVICSAHWSSGKRENKNQLPDIICTKEYAANVEKEYSQTPSRELKRKVDCTKTVLTSSNANTVRSTPRKPPKDRSETPVPRVKKRRVSAANVEKESQKLKSQVESLTRELNEKKALIEDLQQQLSKTQTELEKNAANNSQQLHAMKKALEGQIFSYEALMRYPDRIYYMTGLSLSELDCLYECLEPFLHTIVYPDCNNDDSSHLRKLDTKTELISFLTICRHALDLGVIAWMTGSSISTMSRIFVGWCVFLSTIFESIDLTPLPGFLNDYMPKCFMESGYGDTALIGDATEIWISQSENFDINNITFSNYKNHTTGKICLWTLPPFFYSNVLTHLLAALVMLT